MPNESPVAAARFGISIDGVQIGQFGAASFASGADIAFDRKPSGAGRELAAHELTHVVQGKGGKFVFGKGKASQYGLQSLRSGGGRRVRVVGVGSDGKPVAAVMLVGAKLGTQPTSASTETVTMTCESIQRVSL